MNDTSLGFGLIYAGNLTYSEVMAADGYYQVLLNSRPIAEVVYDETFVWRLSAGAVLPQSIINEIGYRIENKFL